MTIEHNIGTEFLRIASQARLETDIHSQIDPNSSGQSYGIITKQENSAARDRIRAFAKIVQSRIEGGHFNRDYGPSWQDIPPILQELLVLLEKHQDKDFDMRGPHMRRLAELAQNNRGAYERIFAEVVALDRKEANFEIDAAETKEIYSGAQDRLENASKKKADALRDFKSKIGSATHAGMLNALFPQQRQGIPQPKQARDLLQQLDLATIYEEAYKTHRDLIERATSEEQTEQKALVETRRILQEVQGSKP
ncbi:MAG: hypothetical protein R3C68_12810 [Myxococcota bacterium]